MSKEVWEKFTELYNTDVIIKRMPMDEILEAFWCFASGSTSVNRKDRLKEIFDKHGIEMRHELGHF